MADSASIPFELHLTAAILALDDVPRFMALCQQCQAKPLLIELARGSHCQQAMASKLVWAETLAGALTFARQDAQIWQADGFSLRRLKIEIPLDAVSRFKTDEASDCYYEWHAKVNLVDEVALRECCEQHGAHLSLNAAKGKSALRFITLREFASANQLHQRVKALTQALQQVGWQVQQQQFEYCVFDDNRALDQGWLQLDPEPSQ